MLGLLLNVNPTKSPGPDGIHPTALKELAEILAKPQTIIFSASIQKVMYQTFGKFEYYCIIQERRQIRSRKYKPVTLTSAIKKLMVKIVREVINNHMIKNDLYSKNNLDLYERDQAQYSYSQY